MPLQHTQSGCGESVLTTTFDSHARYSCKRVGRRRPVTATMNSVAAKPATTPFTGATEGPDWLKASRGTP
jgi:hypothetical protein